VFFVDGIAFLFTVSRQIKFITTENVITCTAKSLSEHLQQVAQVYLRGGFTVCTILMDGEFKKVKVELPMLVCNTTAAKEHVSKAECLIWSIKERTRGVVCTLPFTYIPWRLKIEFIYFITLWLNVFPMKTGILGVYLPHELLVRWRLDYKKHCRVLPDSHCKVHKEPVPSNTMMTRTHKCIACSPTENLHVSITFYCLKMGLILKWRSFMPLPMPDWIIKHVDQIGLRKKQGWEFQFVNRSKEPYEWTDTVLEDDPEFQGLLEEEAPFPDVSADVPGVVLEEEGEDKQVVTDKLEVPFEALVAAALENADIDRTDQFALPGQQAMTGIGPARRPWHRNHALWRPTMMRLYTISSYHKTYSTLLPPNIIDHPTMDLPDAGLILPDCTCTAAHRGSGWARTAAHPYSPTGRTPLSYTISQECSGQPTIQHVHTMEAIFVTWRDASAQECACSA
jgi:hypothetical protein